MLKPVVALVAIFLCLFVGYGVWVKLCRPATYNQITLKSYKENIEKYVAGTAQTVSGDFKTWIDSALSLVDKKAKILEIGSGFGRDADYIQSQGFSVQCSDALPGFIALLRERGLSAQQINILTDELDGTFDMVLASAVFLHMTKAQFKTALFKINQHLSPGGVLAFSVKEGVGEEWVTDKLGKSPRYFHYWQADSLTRLLRQTSFEIITLMVGTTAGKWLLVIARKK